MIKASDAAPIHISLGLDRGSEINQVSPGGHGQSSVTFTGVFRRQGKEGRALLSLAPGVPHPAESSRENTGHQHHCQAILRSGTTGRVPLHQHVGLSSTDPAPSQTANPGTLGLFSSVFPYIKGSQGILQVGVTSTWLSLKSRAQRTAQQPRSLPHLLPDSGEMVQSDLPFGGRGAGPWANSRGRCQAAGLGLHLPMN